MAGGWLVRPRITVRAHGGPDGQPWPVARNPATAGTSYGTAAAGGGPPWVRVPVPRCCLPVGLVLALGQPAQSVCYSLSPWRYRGVNAQAGRLL
jgi:hypothetical protein